MQLVSPMRPAIRSALRSPLDYNYGGATPRPPLDPIFDTSASAITDYLGSPITQS